MSGNTSGGSSTKPMFVIHTYQGPNVFDQKLLKVVNNTVTVDVGKQQDFQDKSVLFYINSHDNSAGDFVRQFQPVNLPNKFLAVSGQNIVLKDSTQVQSDNSHNFVEESANPDYMKYKVESSPANSPLYMYHDNNGKVITSLNSNSNQTWFKTHTYHDSTVTVTKALLLTSESSTEFKEITVWEE